MLVFQRGLTKVHMWDGEGNKMTGESGSFHDIGMEIPMC